MSASINSQKFKCPHCYRELYVNPGLGLSEELRMRERIEALTKALRDVEDTLTVPAAEFVPAIPDAWDIIEQAIGKKKT